MPLTTSFSVSQPAGDASVVILEDTSTGTDGTVTARRVYLQKWDGTYLTPTGNDEDYVEWEIGEETIEIDALDKDYALNIIILWVDTNGSALYTDSEKIGCTQFNENFDYQLTQLMSGNPLLVNDGRFFHNKSELRTLIDSGNKAVELVSDISGAQQCYDRATAMRLNASALFSATFN
jgi:hypothetical protein